MPATCALCGASNPVSRVYRALFASKPNLLSISCRECGRTSSQLRSLPEYVAFSVVYAVITLILVIVGVHLLFGQLRITWIAGVAATIPWTFLPAWWANRQAGELAQNAPAEEVPVGRRLVWLLVALTLIATIVAGGLFAYLFAAR